jgi:hypothetical protein
VRGSGQGARVKRLLQGQHTLKKSRWDQVARKKKRFAPSRHKCLTAVPLDVQDDMNFLFEAKAVGSGASPRNPAPQVRGALLPKIAWQGAKPIRPLRRARPPLKPGLGKGAGWEAITMGCEGEIATLLIGRTPSDCVC